MSHFGHESFRRNFNRDRIELGWGCVVLGVDEDEGRARGC